MKSKKSKFDGLVRDEWQAVYQFAIRLCRNTHDAEDVVQQTFFYAWKSWDTFRGQSSPRTWLIRIAIHTAKRVLQKRHASPSELTSEVETTNDPAREGMLRENAESVREALQTLKPIHRLVLTLFTMEGLTHQEIADLLECPTGTVWSRLHQAKEALEKKLATKMEDLQ